MPYEKLPVIRNFGLCVCVIALLVGIGPSLLSPVLSKSIQLNVKADTEDVKAKSGYLFMAADEEGMRGLLMSEATRVSTGQHDKELAPEAVEAWTAKFGDVVLNKWWDGHPIAGQATARIVVYPDRSLRIEKLGTSFVGAATLPKSGAGAELKPSDDDRQEFADAVKACLAISPADVPVPPCAVTVDLTFGFDTQKFPRYQPEEFGAFARREDDGNLIIVSESGVCLTHLAAPVRYIGAGFTHKQFLAVVGGADPATVAHHPEH
jgi:hypothetical protein